MKYKLKKDLEDTIRSLKQTYKVDADIKVSVHDIKNKVKTHVNGNSMGWAASIIKVPILVSALEEVEKGKLNLYDPLTVDHKFCLEKEDTISQIPNGTQLSVAAMIDYMIVESDNEATNLLADKIGIETINKSAWNLGMKNTMLGHLLCPGVPRYTSEFNPDGSNVTRPNDMVKIMRHIYDPKYSKLSKNTQQLADSFMKNTNPHWLRTIAGNKIKSKTGMIHCTEDGADVHETAIIDDNLIVCIMLNKLNQKKSQINEYFILDQLDDMYLKGCGYFIEPQLKEYLKACSPIFIYDRIMEPIDSYLTDCS